MANLQGMGNKELICEWARANLEKGRLYSRSMLIDWFMAEHVELKSRASISADFVALTVNHSSRHHYSFKKGGVHDLLCRISSREVRLWDAETDEQLTKSDGKHTELTESEPEYEEALLHDQTENEFNILERDLQNFLVRNLQTIEPGLKLFKSKGQIGIEYAAGGGRRIDILAEDKNGDLVVVELKAVRAYDRVVGQLARYMAYIEQEVADERKVRGIIIAPEITDDLRLATKFIQDRVKLMQYSMTFDLQSADNRDD